jgi:solute carrier family 25 carnitine/acylcarnitine transporter 20/29
VKTNMQKRALSNQPYRTIPQTLKVLLEGPDPLNPQPLSRGLVRLYRGLGVSAARSCFTHGLLVRPSSAIARVPLSS